MPSRRNQITLSEEEQKLFLEEGWTLQVATNSSSGFPHLAAMWYIMKDDMIHFTTFRKSQKILNIRRNPNITAMLESGKEYAELQGLVVQGAAELVDEIQYTADVMAKVAEKYRGMPINMADSDSTSKAASKRIAVRIRPQNIYSWDHTKLSGRY